MKSIFRYDLRNFILISLYYLCSYGLVHGYLVEDYEIVVARYNEDISWILKAYPGKTTIYDKGKRYSSDSIVLYNVGAEHQTYLYHIIKNYDRLPEKIIFLQGGAQEITPLENFLNPDVDFFSNTIHVWGKGEERYETWKHVEEEFVDSPYKYYERGDRKPEEKTWPLSTGYFGRPIQTPTKNTKTIFGDYWDKYLPNIKKPNPEEFMFQYSGFYSISKNAILRHSKNFYQHLIKSIDYAKLTFEIFLFERAVYQIFTGDRMYCQELEELLFDSHGGSLVSKRWFYPALELPYRKFTISYGTTLFNSQNQTNALLKMFSQSRVVKLYDYKQHFGDPYPNQKQKLFILFEDDELMTFPENEELFVRLVGIGEDWEPFVRNLLP